MASRHFLSFIESSMKQNWDSPAVSDYDGQVSMSYGELARQIAKIHILFEESGVQKGDKIAICGRNSSNWAAAFLAISTYEAVAVSILPEFNPDSIHTLINHSEAKFLFVGAIVWKDIDLSKIPGIVGIASLTDFEILFTKNEAAKDIVNQLDTLFLKKFPNGFSKSDVSYPTDNMDNLALINYTSGTTSAPKGVMLSNLSISSNVQFGQDGIPNQPGWSMISMLPLAHMFGLTFEFLYQLAGGCHVYFLNRMPTPQVLMKAFADVHPYMILTVPLVIEKIFKKSVFPTLKKPMIHFLWSFPGLNKIVRKRVRDQLIHAFGDQLQHLIIGGAALSHDVEKCMKKIKFPYTVGYGMTECGPILGYEHWSKFKRGSCGKPVHRMTVTVDSDNPAKTVGEILVKGDNVMMGYYKNPEATQSVLSSDGWLRTGDLGLIDKAGNIFIKGRNKSVIVGSSGQNIYPEEIEDKLNNMDHIVESVVLERKGRLVALVFADVEALTKEYARQKIDEIMEIYRQKLNKMMPAFYKVYQIELVHKEFEKTPKRSIKRFLYK